MQELTNIENRINLVTYKQKNKKELILGETLIFDYNSTFISLLIGKNAKFFIKLYLDTDYYLGFKIINGIIVLAMIIFSYYALIFNIPWLLYLSMSVNTLNSIILFFSCDYRITYIRAYSINLLMDLIILFVGGYGFLDFVNFEFRGFLVILMIISSYLTSFFFDALPKYVRIKIISTIFIPQLINFLTWLIIININLIPNTSLKTVIDINFIQELELVNNTLHDTVSITYTNLQLINWAFFTIIIIITKNTLSARSDLRNNCYSITTSIKQIVDEPR